MRIWIAFLSLAVAVAVLVSALAVLNTSAPSTPDHSCLLTMVGRISLPNAGATIDHMALDAKTNTLYIADRGNNTLAVVDVAAQRLIRTVVGLDAPQSLTFVNSGRELAVSNGGNGTVAIFDTVTFRTLNSIHFGSDADNMAFNQAKGLLYVGFGEGWVALVNTTSWRVLNAASLPGHPESVVLDPAKDLVYANVPAGNFVAVIDGATGVQLGDIPLQDTMFPFPLAFDNASGELFIGTRSPPYLIGIDTHTGKEVFRTALPGDTDDIGYDHANGCLYASSGTGFVSVFRQVGNGVFERLQSIPTSDGARTSLLDAANGYFYLASPQHNSTSGAITIYLVGP